MQPCSESLDVANETRSFYRHGVKMNMQALRNIFLSDTEPTGFGIKAASAC